MAKTGHFEPAEPKIFEAVELEQAILGAMMIEKAGCYEALKLLKPEYFYDHKHVMIFKAIAHLARQKGAIDLITVTEQLKRSNNLDVVGGPFYVTQLTSRVASTVHVEYYCRIIIEQWIQRELLNVAERIKVQSQANNDILSNFQIAMDDMGKIGLAMEGKSIQTTKSIAADIAFNLHNRKPTDPVPGLLTPFDNFNARLVALQPGSLYIIAARPSVGKTALALQIAYYVSKKVKVAVFSLEMSAAELVRRLISSESNINNTLIKKGTLNQYELDSIDQVVSEINDNLIIDDGAGLTAESLRVKAINLKVKYNIELIVLDYLQLMEANNKYSNNRENDISTISRALKRLAKELKIPVIALSQLSRETEKRKTGKPTLSDLRESGAIEQDADVVMFLYQPARYLSKDELDPKTLPNETEMIFAKNRDGDIGPEYLQFIPSLVKFKEISPEEPDTNPNF